MAYSNDTGYPSVTEVLRPFIDDRFFTEEGRERGSAVHDAIHAYLTGEYALPLPEWWQAYFDSFKTWAEDFQPKPIMCETRLIDPKLKYCGMFDTLAVVEKTGEGLGIVDWKTGQAKTKLHQIQIAAYRNLLKVNGIETQFAGILRLREFGGMAIYDQCPSDYRADFNRFVGCLNMHHYLKS